MSRVLIIIAIVLAVLLGGVMFLLANPEYYKDRIYATVEEESGFELTINGEMSWRYWPPIALAMSDVELRPAGSDAPLATFSSAAIDMELLPLLLGSDELAINGISLDGLTVTARVDANGKANWDTGTKTESPAPDAEAASSDAGSFGLNIQSISITNVDIDYQDKTSDTHYSIVMHSFRSGQVRFDSPTPVSSEIHLVDEMSGMTVDLALDGQMTFGQGFSSIGWSALNANQKIVLPDMAPLELDITADGRFDLDASTLDTTLKGQFDKSTIDGSLGALLADRTSITFDLGLNTINLNDYMGSGETEPAADARPVDSEVLPRELIRSMDVSGQFRIGMIQYETYSFSDFVADVEMKNSTLDAALGMSGYDGRMTIDFNGTAAGAGAGHTNVKVDGIDIVKLTGFESITGKINLDSNTTFTGHMLSDVLGTLDGTSNFAITDGTLDVTAIKGMATTIDSLRGADSGIGGWPDQMPFKRLTGVHRISSGIKENQTFSFELENLTVNGKGGLDYFSDHLAYDVELKMEENTGGQFTVAPGLARITWPLHCEGSLAQSPVDLCLADRSAIQQLITEVAKQEVKRKGEDAIREKLKDKVPEDLQEAAEGLLKNLFKKDD